MMGLSMLWSALTQLHCASPTMGLPLRMKTPWCGAEEYMYVCMDTHTHLFFPPFSGAGKENDFLS